MSAEGVHEEQKFVISHTCPLLYFIVVAEAYIRSRSLLYYLLYCIYLGTELIAPYIVSATMGTSAYIPLALTILCLAISLLVLASSTNRTQDARQNFLSEPRRNLSSRP